jgi:curved DNA-binding protein CbpA
MTKDQCFMILELDKHASVAEIKQSYRDLVTVWHPDKFTHNVRLKAKAEERMKLINIAYSTLMKGWENQSEEELNRKNQYYTASKGTNMKDSQILDRYAEIFKVKFGGPVEVRSNALWFCKNIKAKNGLQWTGYLGECSGFNRVLALGLNLEFTTAWRRICRKIKENENKFQSLLAGLHNAEWHWWGRPGFKMPNPPTITLQKPMPASQVNVHAWLKELARILDGTKTWSNGQRMRPQMQIMFVVGQPTVPLNKAEIERNMGVASKMLDPIISLLL